MSVLVLVEVKANPARREELRALLQGNMHEITAAEGCEGVRIHANADDPNILLFVEYWESGAIAWVWSEARPKGMAHCGWRIRVGLWRCLSQIYRSGWLP